MIVSLMNWNSKVEIARVTDLYLTDRNLRMDCKIINYDLFSGLFSFSNKEPIFVLNFNNGEKKRVSGSVVSKNLKSRRIIEVILNLNSYEDLITKSVVTNVTVENILLKRKLTLRSKI